MTYRYILYVDLSPAFSIEILIHGFINKSMCSGIGRNFKGKGYHFHIFFKCNFLGRTKLTLIEKQEKL